MTACNVRSASPPPGRKVLEVIATSVEDAIEAEQGGADRLEIVAALDQGGLTPSLGVVREIMAAVCLPVRVMLRPDDSMSLAQESERQSERGAVKSCQLDRLTSTANKFAQLQVDGLVLGYICDGHVDQDALHHILAAVPDLPVTFHRAFELVQSPLQALTALKSFGQIDRLLVRVSEDGDGIPLSTLQIWQQHASPEIRLVAGVGLNRLLLQAIGPCPDLSEIHIGRGARHPETNFGRVSRIKVAQWKSALLWA